MINTKQVQLVFVVALILSSCVKEKKILKDYIGSDSIVSYKYLNKTGQTINDSLLYSCVFDALKQEESAGAYKFTCNFVMELKSGEKIVLICDNDLLIYKGKTFKSICKFDIDFMNKLVMDTDAEVVKESEGD